MWRSRRRGDHSPSTLVADSVFEVRYEYRSLTVATLLDRIVVPGIRFGHRVNELEGSWLGGRGKFGLDQGTVSTPEPFGECLMGDTEFASQFARGDVSWDTVVSQLTGSR